MRKHKSTLKRILSYISEYKWSVIFSVLFAAITVALTLYAPILVGRAIDYILAPGQVDFITISKILMKIGVIIMLTAVSQWIMNIINNRVTYKVVKDIRTRAFRQLQILPLKYIDSHQHGDIISRVIADVDQFSEGLLMGFTQLFTGVITILGTLLFMLSLNVYITIVVVLITPLSLFVANYIAKKTYHMFKAQSETKGEMTSLINEMLGNQKIVKAFGQEKEVIGQFEEINGFGE